MVGKYLTDTTGTDVAGFIPTLVDHVPHNDDGVGGMHVYMPWWLDNKKLDFPRGYHIEVWGGPGQPGVRLHGRHPAATRRAAATARQLKDDYRQLLRHDDRLRRPRRDDPQRRTRTARSIPTRRRPVRHPGAALPLEVERPRVNQVKHMQETFRALIAEMGGTVVRPDADAGAGLRHRRPAGTIIHELGGARMGSDPTDVGAQRATARRTT